MLYTMFCTNYNHLLKRLSNVQFVSLMIRPVPADDEKQILRVFPEVDCFFDAFTRQGLEERSSANFWSYMKKQRKSEILFFRSRVPKEFLT